MVATSCRHKAMDFLARREHSRHELTRKLESKCYSSEEIESTLDSLVRDNLLSDQRFAEAYVSSRSKRGFGPQRIARELSQRGIDESIQQQAIDTCEVDWWALAREQQQKKFKVLPKDYRDKAKQARFLQYRGFSFEQINAVFSLDDL